MPLRAAGGGPARPPRCVFPGGTEMPPSSLRLPAPPGTHLRARSSLAPARGAVLSLPGSPPTPATALTEGAELPRRPWGMERFAGGLFVRLQYRSCADAVCSPPTARKLCTWASSQHTEDLCFPRSFINLTTYGSIHRASPPPPPGCWGWAGALLGCPVPLHPGSWAPCWGGKTPKEKKHTAQRGANDLTLNRSLT